MSVSISKYSMFEAQLSRVLAPWIQFMWKKVQRLLQKESIQVLSLRDRPRATSGYKK
jgi:hypothetical protein